MIIELFDSLDKFKFTP